MFAARLIPDDLGYLLDKESTKSTETGGVNIFNDITKGSELYMCASRIGTITHFVDPKFRDLKRFF